MQMSYGHIYLEVEHKPLLPPYDDDVNEKAPSSLLVLVQRTSKPGLRPSLGQVFIRYHETLSLKT